MAKSVVINGVQYPDVPHILVPLASGSGNAKFVDTDSGDAVAGDLRDGKKAWVDGVEVTGNKPENDSSDVTVSGKTVSVPAGIYDSPVSKSVADGAVTPGATVAGSVIGDTSSDYPVTVTPSAAVSPGYVEDNETGTAITKYVQTETKTVSPTTAQQSVTPTNGKLLAGVTVNPVDVSADATESDVMNGKTFFSNSLTRKTGTATVPTVGQDSTTKVLTIQ